MKRPKKQEKNERGSALAYVLIFGVIIMILVVGLLSVGKSGIAFSQESVESRQAYIDAKSVIEFGKIEIGKRVEALEEPTEDLHELYKEYEEIKEEGTEEEIRDLKDKIDEAEKDIDDILNQNPGIYAEINPDTSRVAETLDRSSEGLDRVGNLKGEILKDSNGNIERSPITYNFKIETENLRRTLDYKVSFIFKEEEIKPAEPEDIIPNKEEIRETINNDNSANKFSKYNKSDNYKKTGENIIFTSNLQTKKEERLDVDCKNLLVQGKLDLNHDDDDHTLNITATESIIIEGKVDLSEDTELKITCKNIWIEHDVHLKEDTKLDIIADNVFIERGVKLKEGNLTITCKNIWINDDIELKDDDDTLLDIIADNIYIKGVKKLGDDDNEFVFKYSSEGKQPTNLYVTKDIAWKVKGNNKTIESGVYCQVQGKFPRVDNKSPKKWLYELRPSDTAEGCPGSGGGFIITPASIRLDQKSERYK